METKLTKSQTTFTGLYPNEQKEIENQHEVEHEEFEIVVQEKLTKGNEVENESYIFERDFLNQRLPRTIRQPEWMKDNVVEDEYAILF